MREKEHRAAELLRQDWQLLQRSLETLQKSVVKAMTLINKADFTFEEMEVFDSLTSKFGRTADIFTKKIIRTVWVLLHEDTAPLIDVLNQAEKIKLVLSSDKLLEIRDLRNQIAHEYIPEAISELVPEVIELSGELEKNIQQAEQFLKQRNWL